jgi:hypothetical protein
MCVSFSNPSPQRGQRGNAGGILVNEMERYLNSDLPFGLVPVESIIGSYRQKHSARALHRVYSVEATFGSEKRCSHRYETGGEPRRVSAASSHQLSPQWHQASGSETQEKMLHSVAGTGANSYSAKRYSYSIACLRARVGVRARESPQPIEHEYERSSNRTADLRSLSGRSWPRSGRSRLLDGAGSTRCGIFSADLFIARLANDRI